MPNLQVGKPYRADHPVVRRGAASAHSPDLPASAECAEYAFHGGEHELVLWLEGATRRELDDVARSECEFALVVENDVLFFLQRFGQSMPWSDAPFSWWLVPEGQRVLPPLPEVEELSAVLHVVVVDAATGIVRALRDVPLVPSF